MYVCQNAEARQSGGESARTVYVHHYALAPNEPAPEMRASHSGITLSRGVNRMQGMHRRSFVEFALGALPFTVFGQSLKTKSARTPVHLRAGEDRFAKTRTLGFSLTTYKVATQDAVGGLFVMEHQNQKKGGPPLHLHHDVDEWFYVIEGDYLCGWAPSSTR
jgi:mannose-6-phosphate isomerase-like protein (cupin superfamily)